MRLALWRLLVAAWVGLSPSLVTAASTDARTLAERARGAFRSGDFTEAVRGFERAIAEGADLPAAELGPLWFDLGAACFARLDLARGREAFTRAIEIFDGMGDPVAAALAREGFTRVLIEQGDMLGAGEAIERALSDIDGRVYPPHPQHARLLGLSAIVLQGREKIEAARDGYSQALAEYRGLLGNQRMPVAAMLQNLASLESSFGDSTLVRVLLQQSLDIVARQTGAGDPARARTFVTVGNWRWARGETHEAETAFGEALDVLERIHGNDHVDRIEPLRGLARCAMTRSDFAGAQVQLERAAEQFERSWPLGGIDFERATAFGSPLLDLSLARLREGNPSSAWQAWAAHVGRTLDLPPGTDAAQRAEDPLRLARRLPERVAWVGWLEIEVQPEWMERWAWILSREGGLRWIALGRQPLDELETQTRSACSSFAVDECERDRLLRTAWNRWFAAIAPVLGAVDHLVLMPTGSLVGLPLELFTDGGGRRVGDRWTVSLSPSIATLVRALEVSRIADRGAPLSLLAVADPQLPSSGMPVSDVSTRLVLRSAAAGNAGALGSLDALHRSRIEAEAIGKHFSSVRILAGADARESEVHHALGVGRGGAYDVVHFATHALVDVESIENNAIVLTGAGAQADSAAADGLVRVSEILERWRLNARLVVLSACETAGGRPTSTDGLLGFPQALFRVGAQQVLVSLWKVDDHATQLFMEAFYAAWLGDSGTTSPVGVSQALRVARRSLQTWKNGAGRTPFDSPAYWGAFVVVGDGR